VEVLEGFQKTGYGVMVFLFYVHYSTYASRPMLDGNGPSISWVGG
jgi:hypothetical protein